MSDLPLKSLPEIQFVEFDPAELQAATVAMYEGIIRTDPDSVDFTLYPGDPERLFLEGSTLVSVPILFGIDKTGKMSLLRYSKGVYLDHLGALHGSRGLRLDSTKSTAEASFTIEEAQGDDLIIPAGTELETGLDDDWEVVDAVTIPAGELTAVGQIICQAAGAQANGFLSGQVGSEIEVDDTTVTVSNTSTSLGGSDPESDPHFRERLWLAPLSYSTCGPRGGYQYWLKSSSPEVIDAEVKRVQPNVISCWILMQNGRLPTDEELATAQAFIESDELMPEGDEALVLAPTEVEQEINLTWYAHKGYAPLISKITETVNTAITDYQARQTTKLGRDFLPGQLEAAVLSVQGVKRIEVTSPTFQALERGQVARITATTTTYGGLEDE